MCIVISVLHESLFLVCVRHVMQLGARTCTPSTIDPACSPTSLLTTTSPPPASHYKPCSPSFTVHHSRQSMSRGGKLAPEVNRYVRHAASRASRKADATNSHDICANMSCLQSSLRKEPEVSRCPRYLICHALILRQLQRHPRGTLRPLWQVRPSAVRRLPHALAHLGLHRHSRLLTLA